MDSCRVSFPRKSDRPRSASGKSGGVMLHPALEGDVKPTLARIIAVGCVGLAMMTGTVAVAMLTDRNSVAAIWSAAITGIYTGVALGWLWGRGG